MMNLLTEEQRGKVEHIASDFLKSPEEIAEAMKKARVTKVDRKRHTNHSSLEMSYKWNLVQ